MKASLTITNPSKWRPHGWGDKKSATHASLPHLFKWNLFYQDFTPPPLLFLHACTLIWWSELMWGYKYKASPSESLHKHSPQTSPLFFSTLAEPLSPSLLLVSAIIKHTHIAFFLLVLGIYTKFYSFPSKIIKLGSKSYQGSKPQVFITLILHLKITYTTSEFILPFLNTFLIFTKWEGITCQMNI